VSERENKHGRAREMVRETKVISRESDRVRNSAEQRERVVEKTRKRVRERERAGERARQ
jgi:hypothetical protein